MCMRHCATAGCKLARCSEGGLRVQDFYDLSPAKFQNKTNGVTPRRWLAYCNPRLAALITQTLGSAEWIKHADQLQVRGWCRPGCCPCAPLPGPGIWQAAEPHTLSTS